MTVFRITALCLLAGCGSIDAPRTDSAALSFTSAMGEPDPASQTLNIQTQRSWRATTTANWIALSPDSALGVARITVSIRPLLLVGDITDTVRITSAGKIVEVPVRMHRTGRPPRGLLYSIPHLVRQLHRDSIYVAGPDGSGARTISFNSGSEAVPDAIWPDAGAVFDPSGERIAFVALLNCCSANTWVYTTNADGTSLSNHWGAFSAPGGTCRGLYGGVTWSPDGQALAGPCAYTNGDRLVIDSLGKGRSTAVPLPASLDRGLTAWSPDGTWILSGNSLVSADRTRPDTTLQVPNGLHGIGWTPDNRIVLGPTAACGSGVSTIPRGVAVARGATPTPLLGPEYSYATFSPDGTKLLAVRCSPSFAVELMDANGTNVIWTMPGANWAAWRP